MDGRFLLLPISFTIEFNCVKKNKNYRILSTKSQEFKKLIAVSVKFIINFSKKTIEFYRLNHKNLRN
jgi:hypothetical protein